MHSRRHAGPGRPAQRKNPYLKCICLLLYLFPIWVSCKSSVSQLRKIKDFPEMNLTENETLIVDLDQYYDGEKQNISIDTWKNDAVRLSFRLPVNYGPKTSIQISDILSIVTMDDDLELNSKFDQNKFSKDWTPFIILTSDQQLLSSSATYLLGTENFIVDANLSLPDDIICKDVVKLSMETLLLDCQLKDPSANQGVWLFVLTIIEKGKVMFGSTVRENNTITVKEDYFLRSYMNCRRTLKYFNERLFRFCKASRHIEVSSYLEVFKVTFDNSVVWFTTLNTATLKSPFFFEDIESFSTNETYVLDFCFGLYRFNFMGAIVFPVHMEPQLIGDVFYKVVADGTRSLSLRDVYEEKRLVVASNRYVTELKFDSEDAEKLILYRRKNLESHIGVVEGLFFSRNNIMVVHRWEANRIINGCTLNLKIFTRDELLSNLVTNIAFERNVFIHFMKNKRELSLSPHEVTTLLAISQYEVQTLEVGCSLLYFSCCSKPLFKDDEYSLAFSIQGVDNEWVSDSLRLFAGKLENADLHVTESSLKISYNLLYPAFLVDLDEKIMGPNKQYVFSNAPNLSLFSEDIVSYNLSFLNMPMKSDLEITFLRGFSKDGHYLFFKQTQDQVLTAYICNIPVVHQNIEELIERRKDEFLKIIECSEIHKETVKSIENVSSRGSEFVISFKDISSLKSYSLEKGKLVYQGDYLNGASLDCDRVLVEFSANYAICVTGNANETSLYMFKIFKGVQNLTFYMLKSSLNNSYQYFDHTLLSNGFLLAKTTDAIHIIRISFDENENLNSAEVSGIIKNEITTSSHFEFAMTRTNYPINSPIQLFLISYDKNIIGEFEIKDITSPLFKRYYPLYDYRLASGNRKPFTNKFILVVPAKLPNDLGATYYLIFDSTRETKNVLRKVYTCKEGIDIFLLDDFSKDVSPSFTADEPDSHVDFLQRDRVRGEWTFYRLQNQILFGSMDDEGVVQSAYIDDKKKLVYKSNFRDPTKYQIEFQVQNGISPKVLNLTLDLNVDFGDTILNFSSSLFEKPDSFKNFSSINLNPALNHTIKLPNFFEGPVENYLITTNCTTHDLQINTFAMFYNSYFVSLEASQNEARIKSYDDPPQTASFLFVDSLEAGRYIFLLSEERILVVDSQSKPKKFAVITSYATGWLCASDSPQSLFIHNDHNSFYLFCTDINKRARLFEFNFTNGTFPEFPTEVRMPVEITQINNLIASEDLFFVIVRSSANLNESNIFILKRDGILNQDSTRNSINAIATVLIGTITPQSFNTDYLFIDTIDIKLWGNIAEGLAYGTIFSYNGYLFYCEFLIEIDRSQERGDVSKKPVVNITNYNYISFQDIFKSANANGTYDSGDIILNLFWTDTTQDGEMTLLVTSPSDIFEIHTSRFSFPEFTLKKVFKEYYMCVNHFNRRPSFSRNFFAYPCLFDDDRIFVKVYKSSDNVPQNATNEEGEDVEPSEEVFHSRILQQIEVDSLQYLEVFLLSEKEGEQTKESLVILTNFGVFLEYNLSTDLTLTATTKSQGESHKLSKFLDKNGVNIHDDADNHSVVNRPEFAFLVANNYFSNISFRISLQRGFSEPPKGLLLFYLLIVLPIIVCVTVMFAICGFIKMYKRKRREMLRDYNLLNESTAI